MHESSTPPADHGHAAQYVTIRQKVDAFAARVTEARTDIRCGAGCTACCQVQLTVSDLEANAMREALRALPVEVRRALAVRLDAHDAGAHTACVLLDEHGRCAAYEARPAVCRSQGMALTYPRGTLEPEAIFARGPNGEELTWCPLNFTEGPPAPDETLDAARIDQILALLNQAASTTPLRRTAITDLAREMVDADRQGVL